MLFRSPTNFQKNIKKSISAANGSITRTLSEVGAVVVYSDDPDFKTKASKIKGIQSVIPNLTIQGIDPDMKVEMGVANSGNPPNSGDDDFFFDLQWGHDAVDAPEAWDTGERGDGVRVFVLDSGIDKDHPDLTPNLNTSLSISFVPDEDWWAMQPFPTFNHGTHVAGTIAAADDGFGVIGIAPEAEIVAVKVLSEYTGSGSFDGILAGIMYATENGADVINMSIGAVFQKSGERPFYTAREAAELMTITNRVITYAYQSGVTVVTSAGNEATDYDHNADEIHWPSEAVHALAISSTAPMGWGADSSTNLDVFASVYSNYGQSTIDFSAPGGSWAYAFEPGGFDPCTVAGITQVCYAFDYVWSTTSGGWTWAAGTSMASPHVAGIAALIIGKNGGSMKPAQVISTLMRSADDLGKPGKDDYYGSGRVNAYRAVTQ